VTSGMQKFALLKNELHDPARRIEFHEEEEAKKNEAVMAKKKKGEEKQLALKQKEDNRAKHTCLEEDCNSVRRGGKGWVDCGQCLRAFCPKHKKSLSFHLKICEAQK